ncbi:MAG: hypothetical protein AMXMBFR31_10020 [Candidatus Desulfobacillus denitrificans]|nr:hypothetical protein [Candidatus Hydrogenedentota bacterium]MCZ2174577.1 hypothetical protein [Burkholderiales bacterium]
MKDNKQTSSRKAGAAKRAGETRSVEGLKAAAGDMSLSEKERLEACGDLAQIENQQLTDKKLADEFADIKENAESVLAQQKCGPKQKSG